MLWELLGGCAKAQLQVIIHAVNTNMSRHVPATGFMYHAYVPPVPACPVGASGGGGILRLVTLEVFWATQDARLGTKLRLL